MAKRAFTVVELLTVLAIVLTISAITYPAFVSARTEAKKARSTSNLRQLWTALELYRQENNGSEFGTPSQMGLPPDDLFHFEIERKHGLMPPHQGPTPIFRQYYYYAPNESFAQEQLVENFVAWSKACKAALPLIADFNFNDEPISLFNPYKCVAGIGVNLSGRISRKRETGNPMSLGWWRCQRETGGDQ